MDPEAKVKEESIIELAALDNAEMEYLGLFYQGSTDNVILVYDNGDIVSHDSSRFGDGNNPPLLGSRKRRRFSVGDDVASHGKVIHEENEHTNFPNSSEARTAVYAVGATQIIMPESPQISTGQEIDRDISLPGLTFHELVKLLKTQIQNANLPQKDFVLGIISALQSRVRKNKDKMVKDSRPHPRPGDEIEKILCGNGRKSSGPPEMMEEDTHSWMKPKMREPDTMSCDEAAPVTPRICLRVWDDRSQARIREGTEGFLSGSNFEPLHTTQLRKKALENHASWKNRVKTVFISTTTDFEEVIDYRVPHFEKRQKRNGLSSVTKLTLINGNSDGMPILQMRKELDFYKCHIPYPHSPSELERFRDSDGTVEETYRQSFFANELLFLFRVTANQVVKTWLWKDIQQWMKEHKTEDTQRWYQEVLVPAYNAHEQARISGSVMHEQDCSCCGH